MPRNVFRLSDVLSMPTTRLLSLSQLVPSDLVHPLSTDIAGEPALRIPQARNFVRDLQALMHASVDCLWSVVLSDVEGSRKVGQHVRLVPCLVFPNQKAAEVTMEEDPRLGGLHKCLKHRGPVESQVPKQSTAIVPYQ